MKKINIRNLNSAIQEEYDIFLCSASFEQRCLSIPSKLKTKKFKKVIILENKNYSKIIEDNAKELYKLYPNSGTLISVEYSNSLLLADTIAKMINSVSGRNFKVLIDITTFTHEALMICLKILNINKKVKSVVCLYVNAMEYCPGQEIDKKWLSQGCEELRPILGYPGLLLPSQKTHLVVIVGYEFNRAFDMITEVEPNSITLAYGSPDKALTEKDREANEFFNGLVQKMAFEFSSIESISVSCNDPRHMAQQLTQIYIDHCDENIIEVPMNNKMSTVGVALAAMQNENVQICYAPAVIYNESNYSLPGKDCYIFDYK